MKTKLLFISLCLVMGMALGTTSAQEKAKKTEQGWIESTYWCPVFCDDVLVDILSGGYIRLHWVSHYNPGKNFWEIDQLKGEVTSDETGETFRIRESDKIWYSGGYQLEAKYNLVGNMGTHYNGTLYFTYTWFPPNEDYPDGYYMWVLTEIGKAICH